MGTLQAKSRVVDQDSNAVGLGLAVEFRGGFRVGEIQRNGARRHAMFTDKAVRQVGETVGPARHQNDGIPVGRARFRQFGADPAGSTGDQGRTLSHGYSFFFSDASFCWMNSLIWSDMASSFSHCS